MEENSSILFTLWVKGYKTPEVWQQNAAVTYANQLRNEQTDTVGDELKQILKNPHLSVDATITLLSAASPRAAKHWAHVSNKTTLKKVLEKEKLDVARLRAIWSAKHTYLQTQKWWLDLFINQAIAEKEPLYRAGRGILANCTLHRGATATIQRILDHAVTFNDYDIPMLDSKEDRLYFYKPQYVPNMRDYHLVDICADLENTPLNSEQKKFLVELILQRVEWHKKTGRTGYRPVWVPSESAMLYLNKTDAVQILDEVEDRLEASEKPFLKNVKNILENNPQMTWAKIPKKNAEAVDWLNYFREVDEIVETLDEHGTMWVRNKLLSTLDEYALWLSGQVKTIQNFEDLDKLVLDVLFKIYYFGWYGDTIKVVSEAKNVNWGRVHDSDKPDVLASCHKIDRLTAIKLMEVQYEHPEKHLHDWYCVLYREGHLDINYLYKKLFVLYIKDLERFGRTSQCEGGCWQKEVVQIINECQPHNVDTLINLESVPVNKMVEVSNKL